ncbi:MAG: 2'-5' RNA ligase family protein [Methanoregula sp.]|jgi:calcineurin-like phosphoesterase family protein|nr:2'-5' RNA ligase family protein [Methanoregula sp.]
MVHNRIVVMVTTMLEDMFLIEIRLGRTKWRIKKTTAEIGRIFNITDFCEKHPHITLFGPFFLKKGTSVAQLQKAIEEAAKSFEAIPFLMHGFEMNQGLSGAVIAYRIIPTDPLVELTEAIMTSVGELAEIFNTWDKDPELKWFHVTIANRLDRSKAAQVFKHLIEQSPFSSFDQEKQGGFFTRFRFPREADRPGEHQLPPPPPILDEDGLRITIVNGDHILSEYDLIQHRWFSPEDPHASSEWLRTLERYRRRDGIERTGPRYNHEEDIFVLSDLHLGHANIIKYCSRPFPHDAVDVMDQVLIRNWNYTIKPGDRVYYIGDLCYGPLARTPFEYIQRLNGRFTLIQGNHDEGEYVTIHSETLVHNNIPFMLIHDPDDMPKAFDGWVIHGHHHNNDLIHYPFINFEKRWINVSAEVVKYQPVSLSNLCNIIKDHQLKPKVKSILLREM